MKKTLLQIILLYGCVLPLLLAVSCQRIGPSEETDSTSGTVRMNVSIDRWDASPTKSGEALPWSDGAQLWIELLSSNEQKKIICAIYSADSDSWSFSDTGFFGWDWSSFSSGECVCYYFESDNWWQGGTSYQGRYVDGVHVNANCPIYGSTGALYTYQNDTLEISAHLVPLTGRVRFEDWPVDDQVPNYQGRVFGAEHLVALDFSTFEWVRSSQPMEYSVNEDGSPYYLYCSFADPANPALTVYNVISFYKRTFDKDFLSSGTSSYCYSPSEVFHNEWFQASSELSIEGIPFSTLCYIPAGTFRMGGEDAQPVHNVTLTNDYYIGSREVTKAIWYSVMGEPEDYRDNNDPVYGKNWDEIQIFIAKLNARTGFSFRLPTEAEWEFAARGGFWANGYRYSGDDYYGNVAIFGWGPTSGGQSGSNECGLFDMSGNVSEWVSDWYAPYTEDAVTNPKGPDNGDVHVRRGGDWLSGDWYLTVSYRDIDSPLDYTGFRLAADIPTIR